ncbi:MAG TPA: DUF1772 domain-containing protein [Acidobacteriaceae bacterium]|jgi:hypothetical protein|nr:DUF1772 domain-containing protein [Acidobacteriaceae bacterium]
MYFLDIVTIVCVGLLIGNELAVSLFINPALWKLDAQSQARATSLLARSLGRAMPFWYILSLLLLFAEVWLRRHQPAFPLLLTAVALWIAIILYTVTTLVPINNRVTAWQPDALPAGWHQAHKKWDTLHRWRILLLILAFVCLICGILGPR